MDIEVRIAADPTGADDTEVTIHCDCSVTIKQQDTTQKVILTREEMDALVSIYQARRAIIV